MTFRDFQFQTIWVKSGLGLIPLKNKLSGRLIEKRRLRFKLEFMPVSAICGIAEATLSFIFQFFIVTYVTKFVNQF
ncbi:MAG: hypothetical protein M3Q78_08495, partial [Acidobacteriota bacterium]|nr:hypothetical protein [Acidobacteriota bacterium]